MVCTFVFTNNAIQEETWWRNQILQIVML